MRQHSWREKLQAPSSKRHKRSVSNDTVYSVTSAHIEPLAADEVPEVTSTHEVLDLPMYLIDQRVVASFRAGDRWYFAVHHGQIPRTQYRRFCRLKPG